MQASKAVEVPPGGAELTHDGQSAGQVTSAAYSPGFQASVALAYVRRPFHEPGVVLDSACGPGTVIEPADAVASEMLAMRKSNREAGYFFFCQPQGINDF